jgi:putative ABC transport system permease protein
MFATQPAAFLDVYPNIKVSPAGSGKAWEQDRQGLIIGHLLAKQLAWKLGQRVPIRSNIWRKTDNTDTWEFNIVGIFESGAPFLDGSAYMIRLLQRSAVVRKGHDRFGEHPRRRCVPEHGDREEDRHPVRELHQ